jgi:hypothetical protein
MPQNETFSQTQEKLNIQMQDYLKGVGVFENFLGIKNIISTTLFKESLIEISMALSETNEKTAKDFELYLQTVIVNMGTKVTKYKKSIYFDNEKIKEIQNQGYVIPFYIDNENYILLGITKEYLS